ncbi:MAG TPA: radical SAM protein [Patescibacteria group bacterium]|nr:radical SAM protein [Patescibacteria group bacterium]
MKKRVVLVYPNIIKGWQARPRVGIPISLLSIAAPALEAGYDVKVIDQRVEPDWKPMLEEELRKDPVCVGVSSMTGPQLRYALEISRAVKAYNNTPVVWGGTHVSLLPEQSLRNDNIDIVVEGEGEETFPELLAALEGKRPLSTVRGIWYKDNGRLVNTGFRPFADLNRQPPLPYHLIDLKKHARIIFGIENMEFFTSRGCPHQCAFCYNVAFHKRKWRPMDADLVIKRLKDFVREYHVKGLYFNDSNFFFDIPRGRKILEGMIEDNSGVIISKINFDIFTLLKMDARIFELLQKANCRWLPIAVESGSKRIQDLIRKPVDVEQLLQMNKFLKKFDMSPHYAFMMGFPTETEEDLAASVSLASRLLKENAKSDAVFNIYTPYPGTELFDIAVNSGLRFPERIEEWFPFHYRNLTQGAPWLSKKMRRLVEMMDFCLNLIGEQEFLRPYRQTSPLASFLCKTYAPLARQRIKHFWYQFPLEIKLAKFLRLYAKQE